MSLHSEDKIYLYYKSIDISIQTHTTFLLQESQSSAITFKDTMNQGGPADLEHILLSIQKKETFEYEF
jgi:hypothetical protein